MKIRNGWAERKPFSWYTNFNDNFEWLMPVTIVGGFFVEAVLGASVDGATHGSALPVVLVMVGWPLIMAFIGFGHKLSGINGINNEDGRVGARSYYYSMGSRDLLRRILTLPREDQRLFPSNLVQTLSRDLHPTEREKINQGILDTVQEIERRNDTRREAEQRAIYTDGVMAALEDARNNVKTETDVLKEFL